MLLELNGIGFTNWCSRIPSVLERAGLDQIWESQNIGDTNKFMLLFKESIVRIFTQQWRKDIESSSKLRTFLGSVRDVSVAFVIRRGGALWRISELLSQLILSMRSERFFFDCTSEYVVLTRS